MCDERERLIEYVYDESDDGQRAEIDRHLETCATCRDEIAGLRATRQDLLAWEVPDHGSVWRPFAPPRLVPWYREVPAWAMATAAGLMFMIGVGGGLTAQVLTKPEPASAQVQVDRQQLTPVSTTQSASEAAAIRAELSALEARMLAVIKANNAKFAQQVSTGGIERVSMRSSMNDDLVMYFGQDLLRINRQLQRLEERNNALSTQLSQFMAGAGAPGR